MAYPYKPIKDEEDDRAKLARQGFVRLPNGDKPNVFIPPSDGALQPAAQFAQAGSRLENVFPGGTATNFPTARDIVGQSVQRALTAKAATQSVAAGSPFLTPQENAVAARKKWTEDQLMAGKDRSLYTVEWESHGMGESPVVRRLTPQQQAQRWEEQNLMVQADVTGKPGPALNIFGGGGHLDTPLLTQSRGDISPAIWANYKRLTREADLKLNQALATRASIPHTIEEAQQFVDSLGFDDRVGEHVERAMTRYLQNANPELYRQLIGQREVQKANDASYVEWVKMNSDPRAARLTPAEILAHRTPESQYAFDRDPNAVRFMLGPEGVTEAPKRVLTPEEEGEKKFKIEQAQRDLQGKRVDEIVARSGGRMVKTYKPDGEPVAMTVEQYQKEQNKLALEQAREERAMTAEDLNIARAEREETAAQNEPKAKRRLELEKRYDLITQRMERRQIAVERGWTTEPVAKIQNIKDMKLLGDIEKELVPEEAAPPATNPPVFADEASARAAGKKSGDIILVNGKKYRLN